MSIKIITLAVISIILLLGVNGCSWLSNLQQQQPDLTVTSILFSDNNPFEGDIITVTAVIENIGTVDAGDILVRTFGGDVLLGEGAAEMSARAENYFRIGNDHKILSLPAGQGESIQFNWTIGPATEGMHNIRIVVDPEINKADDIIGEIIERDEKNNDVSRNIYVDSKSLKPYAVYGYVYASDRVTTVEGAVITITNTATGENMVYTTDSKGRYLENLLNFPSGYAYGNQIKIRASYLSYTSGTTITAQSQSGGTQADISISGLSLISSDNPLPSVSPGTNLQLLELQLSDNNLIINNPVTFMATIFNQGTEVLSNIKVRLYVYGKPVCVDKTIPSLVSGGIEHISLVWEPKEVTSSGKHVTISLAVDPDNIIAEISENDNSLTASKIVRDLLSYDVRAGWNKVTMGSLSDGFSAGAIVSGMNKKIEYLFKITEPSPGVKKVLTFIPDFSDLVIDFPVLPKDRIIIHSPLANINIFGWCIWYTTSGNDGLVLTEVRRRGWQIIDDIRVPCLEKSGTTIEIPEDNLYKFFVLQGADCCKLDAKYCWPEGTDNYSCDLLAEFEYDFWEHSELDITVTVFVANHAPGYAGTYKAPINIDFDIRGPSDDNFGEYSEEYMSSGNVMVIGPPRWICPEFEKSVHCEPPYDRQISTYEGTVYFAGVGTKVSFFDTETLVDQGTGYDVVNIHLGPRTGSPLADTYYRCYHQGSGTRIQDDVDMTSDDPWVGRDNRLVCDGSGYIDEAASMVFGFTSTVTHSAAPEEK